MHDSHYVRQRIKSGACAPESFPNRRRRRGKMRARALVSACASHVRAEHNVRSGAARVVAFVASMQQCAVAHATAAAAAAADLTFGRTQRVRFEMLSFCTILRESGVCACMSMRSVQFQRWVMRPAHMHTHARTRTRERERERTPLALHVMR